MEFYMSKSIQVLITAFIVANLCSSVSGMEPHNNKSGNKDKKVTLARVNGASSLSAACKGPKSKLVALLPSLYNTIRNSIPRCANEIAKLITVYTLPSLKSLLCPITINPKRFFTKSEHTFRFPLMHSSQLVLSNDGKN